MASETVTERPLAATVPISSATVPISTDDATSSRPIEALQIEEPRNEEEDIVFPTGPKLWSTVVSMCIALYLSGLVSHHTHNHNSY